MTGTGTLLVIWALSIGAAMIVGSYKGRMGTGALLGVLLGVIGVIVIACLPATYKVKVEREARRQRIRDDAQRQLRGQP
jgi:hypothetical protein